MKLTLHLTQKPTASGHFYIYTTLDAQTPFQAAAIQLLKSQLQVETSKSRRSLETIAIFKTPNESEIAIVRDDFFGVVIESTDFSYLQTVFEKLQAAVSV